MAEDPAPQKTPAKTMFAAAFVFCILAAMVLSFSEPLGLNHWFPGLDAWISIVVGAVFLAVALGGLFHRINRRTSGK